MIKRQVWAEDYDLYSRMLKSGAYAAALEDPLMLVRIHSGSQTTNLKVETIQKDL